MFRRTNLESNAIIGYRKNHRAALLPVDLPTPEESFFVNWARLDAALKEKSPRYRDFAALDESRIRTRGFTYLNSELCDRHWESVDEVMGSEIESLDHPEFAATYRTWLEHNERREDAMLKNVDRYCSHFAFSKPAFLVGAAHRRSLISRSTGESRPTEVKIGWVLPTL